jgi:hypothetical protein
VSTLGLSDDPAARHRIARWCVDVERALGRVGASAAQVRALLGSTAEGGVGFLVGSLATGLGNQGSDIDVNVFRAERTSDAPMMFFLGRTSVDVQHYARQESERIVAALSASTVRLGGACCALGPAPDPRTQRRLSRWLTACPLSSDARAIFTDEEVERASAALVRGAVEQLVRLSFTAGLLDSAGALGELGWRRAGRALVELLARAHGDVFIGEKWLVARALRCGADRDLVQRIFATTSAELLRGVLGDSGLDALSTPELCSLRVREDLEEVSIAGRAWTVANNRRLLGLSLSDLLPAQLTRTPADLLDALTEGVVELEVNHDALDEALLRCAA